MTQLVDARGLLCPWPVIRLGRAAREMGGSGTVRVLADDPVAGREIEALCAERGWHFSADPALPDTYEITIRSNV